MSSPCHPPLNLLISPFVLYFLLLCQSLHQRTLAIIMTYMQLLSWSVLVYSWLNIEHSLVVHQMQYLYKKYAVLLGMHYDSYSRAELGLEKSREPVLKVFSICNQTREQRDTKLGFCPRSAQFNLFLPITLPFHVSIQNYSSYLFSWKTAIVGYYLHIRGHSNLLLWAILSPPTSINIWKMS